MGSGVVRVVRGTRRAGRAREILPRRRSGWRRFRPSGISTATSSRSMASGGMPVCSWPSTAMGALPRRRQVRQPDCFVGEFDPHDAGSRRSLLSRPDGTRPCRSSARRRDAGRASPGPAPPAPTAGGALPGRRRPHHTCAGAYRGWPCASATAARRSGDPSSDARGIGAPGRYHAGPGPGSGGRSPARQALRDGTAESGTTHCHGALRRTWAIAGNQLHHQSSLSILFEKPKDVLLAAERVSDDEIRTLHTWLFAVEGVGLVGASVAG